MDEMQDRAIMIVASEGLDSAFTFLRNPSGSWEERTSVCQKLADLLLGREQAINDARGITLFALGGLIHNLKTQNSQHQELWQNFSEVEEWWQFGDFCKHILNMSLSKANTLERIWMRSQHIDFRPEEIEHVGWNAAQNIIRLAKKREDVEELLDEYNSTPTNTEFIAKIQERLPTITRTQHTTKRIFELSTDEAAFIDESLELAATDAHRQLIINWTAKEALIFVLTQWRQWRETTQQFEKNSD